MTLAALPVICTLRMSRMQAAIAVGLIMWVAGGAAPLLLPNPLMGPTQRLIHTIEILTQNASLGITAVLLPRAKQARVEAVPVAAPAHGHPATGGRRRRGLSRSAPSLECECELLKIVYLQCARALIPTSTA